jgi:hypothetical protein
LSYGEVDYVAFTLLGESQGRELQKGKYQAGINQSAVFHSKAFE